MKEKVVEAENIVIQGLQDTARFYGVNEIYAKLYGILFFEEELSLSELALKSGYALSTVSTCIKSLERWKIVKRRKIPKDRKVYYFAEKDFFEMTKNLMKFGLEGEVRIMLNTIEKSLEILKDVDDERAKKDIESLGKLKNYYNLTERLGRWLLKIEESEFVRLLRKV
ncbi:MAG: GbsR/MarR family transcriptional regulator [Candidatus Methanofastidiosia archaeon]